MIKAIFFDIDGTLVSFKTHKVPQSAIDAIHETRKKGVKVFIATGRPYPFVDIVSDVEYDGVVSTNGSCFIDNQGRTIFEYPIDKEDVRRMVDYQSKTPIAVAYASNERAIVTHYNESFQQVFDLLDIKVPEETPAEEALSMDVIQIIAFFTEKEEEDIMQNVLLKCSAQRWHPDFADCIMQGIDKSAGIMKVIDHYGIGIDETMAFGDGGNDIQMLEFAGVGVAMGNASDAVKAVADIVTSSVDDNGIANILSRIDEF